MSDVKSGFVAFCLAFLALVPVSTQASGQQVKTQAPGFYRMMLGDFEVTALSDGVVNVVPKQFLQNTTPSTLAPLLDKAYESDSIPTSVNAFLVNTGDALVLIDTGAGTVLGPSLGKLVANIQAAGYRPDQVDAVLITHMHPDHFGGLSSKGVRTFPNAVVYASKQDAEVWLNPEELSKAVDDNGKMGKYRFAAARDAFSPYAAEGKLKLFEAPSEPFKGFKAIGSRGHTLGHSFFLIESKQQRMMFWGDLVHVGAVQFDEPQVTMFSDMEPSSAISTRLAGYTEAAKERYFVAAAHQPFPGMGHVRKASPGFAWVPVTYDIPK